MLPHLTHGTKQKNKTSNIIDSVSLGFANGVDGPVSPLDAPDSDYLHWVDFSVPARNVEGGGLFERSLFIKSGISDNTNSYTDSGIKPASDGLINGLKSANYSGGQYMVVLSVVAAPLQFSYPSMTVFSIIQPKYDAAQDGVFLSDYGSVVNKLLIVRAGNASLQVTARLRDSSGNTILASSGIGLLSLNTTYLIVAKLDGANRQIDLWVDGLNNAFSDTNPLYDNTTTWEGTYNAGAIPSLGVLAGGTNPFKGYIGSLFITKTALSNTDINKYANWMADKWGTTWVDI